MRHLFASLILLFVLLVPSLSNADICEDLGLGVCEDNIDEISAEWLERVDSLLSSFNYTSKESALSLIEDLATDVPDQFADTWQPFINKLSNDFSAHIGGEFRCSLEYAGQSLKGSVVNGLKNIVGLQGELQTGLCSVSPSTLYLSSAPNLRSDLVFSGYGFSNSLKVYAYDNNGGRTDASSFFTLPSLFQLKLELGQGQFEINSNYQRIRLMDGKKVLSEVAIVSDLPLPACATEKRTCRPGAINFNSVTRLRGDSEFNGNSVRWTTTVTLQKGTYNDNDSIDAKVKMYFSEQPETLPNNLHTIVGSTIVKPLCPIDDDYELVRIEGVLEDTHSSIVSGFGRETIQAGNVGPYSQLSVRGDTPTHQDDIQGTNVDVSFNPINYEVRQIRNCTE